MSTRREFLRRAAAISFATATSLQVAQVAHSSAKDLSATMTTRKIARKAGLRVRSLNRRDETILRYGGAHDTWHMTWAKDDQQYATGVEGGGFAERSKADVNSRLFSVRGGPQAATFSEVDGYPMRGIPMHRVQDTRYLNYGTLALDDCLYQFLSSYNRSLPDFGLGADPSSLGRFTTVKLIYSPNGGRTWHNQDGSTPVRWEDWGDRSRNNMVFFEEDQDAFSMLTVLQMGKNYEHNRDGYVYIYGINGNTEGTMNELVMFRVPKNKIPDRSSYEFFAGLCDSGNARWTRDIQSREVVQTFPRGWVNSNTHPYGWLPNVVYYAPTGQYLLANWSTGLSSKGRWFSKPSYLGFWVAQNPWGPWEQIHEETAWTPGGDPKARAFMAQIAPKWIAPDGSSFWLVWSDIQMPDPDAVMRFSEKYKYIGEGRAISETDVAEFVALRRKAMPYYGFNVQRVDVVIS